MREIPTEYNVPKKRDQFQYQSNSKTTEFMRPERRERQQ